MEPTEMKNFPTRAPVGMLLGTVLGLLSIVPVFALWHRSRGPLERFYFPQYLGSTLAQTPVGTAVSYFGSRRNTRRYVVLLQNGKPLTGRSLLTKGKPVSIRFVETTPHIFSLWLQNQIYGGREFRAVLQTPLALWAALGISLFLAGLAWDCARRKRAREGVSLRGPDLLTRRAFNRTTKGDGFTLHVRD
jgi:hypothetical protein